MISLKCPECGATLTVKTDHERYFCEYCGAELEVDWSDEVRIESIRSKTYENVEKGKRELEMEKLRRASEQSEKEESRRDIEDFKRGKAIKIIIGLMIVIGIACWMAFLNDSPIAGVVAVIQLILLVLALLNGFHVIQPGKKNRFILYLIIAVVLILPFFYFQQHHFEYMLFNKFDTSDSQKDTSEAIQWSEIKLGNQLPEPPVSEGIIYENTDSKLDLYLYNMSEDERDAYIEQCKEKGFSIDIYEPYSSRRAAFNKQGYKLSLNKDGTEDNLKLEIYLLSPVELDSIDWPNAGVAKGLPKPKSEVGNIREESADTFSAYVGDTSKPEYDEYVKKCINKGYKVDYDKYERSFSAVNKRGDNLEVDYYGNGIMYIYVYNWDLE